MATGVANYLLQFDTQHLQTSSPKDQCCLVVLDNVANIIYSINSMLNVVVYEHNCLLLLVSFNHNCELLIAYISHRYPVLFIYPLR